MWEILAAILCSILMLLGLVGTILPILPGIPLAWIGLFIYAIGTGFQKISVTTTIVFLIITLGVMAVGYFAPMMGAQKYKASRSGIIGAFLGLTIGIIIFNVWGLILGPFLGALAGELIVKKPPEQAIKSALGTLVGFVAGTLLQVIAILTMVGFFLSSLF
jgi:uncharacterized protein YqgC (DUF456 family)